VITTIDRITSTTSPPAGPLDPGRIGSGAGATPAAGVGPGKGAGSSFATELIAAGRERDVNLSGHALRRLEQRQIDVGADELDRLGRAMDMLAARGGRQSLVMLDQVAYVVHVPSHTVVTAVAPNDSKEAVFTQIDSVVIG
jgi:flagellar operon protein